MAGDVAAALGGLGETALITLAVRASESRRPDALTRDETAEALVDQLGRRGYDFSKVGGIPMSELNRVTLILRSLGFDAIARQFLARHPGAVVVHIGCGLDGRLLRVDDGQTEWYDLDLPPVIALRRDLLGGQGERYHLLAASVHDEAWLEAVGAPRGRSFLFLAEGVFMYFTEAQVRSLVLRLCAAFPGAELVFDGFSPLHVWRSNRELTGAGYGTPFRWGLWGARTAEAWGAGIKRLGDWGYLNAPEPRLGWWRRLRRVPLVAQAGRIYRFRLGGLPGEKSGGEGGIRTPEPRGPG